jgi:hypothetical protein
VTKDCLAPVLPEIDQAALPAAFLAVLSAAVLAVRAILPARLGVEAEVPGPEYRGD